MTDNNQPPNGANRDGPGAADRSDRSAGPPATVSRRGLLFAAATAGTIGIPGRVGGSATGTRSDGAVAVGGTERHRRLSRAVVGEVRRAHPGVQFADRSSGAAAGFERLAAGELDAYLSDRPMLPAERCRAADDGTSFAGVELALDGVALVHDRRAWYDTVSTDARLVGTWAGDVAVGTYAEVDPADAERAERVLGRDPLLPAPSDDEHALVRGTRAFQYERGFGGLGYYEPSAGTLRSPADGGTGAGSRTSLVRLAYLYVDGESAGRPAVAALRRAYRDRAARTIGEVAYAADPTGLAT